MTDEELERLTEEITGQLAELTDTPDKPLSKEDRKKQYLLKAKQRALEKIKTARESGSARQEVRAQMDYALLNEYGHRNWILYNLARSRMMMFGI
jgi:hypothetical protein